MGYKWGSNTDLHVESPERDTEKHEAKLTLSYMNKVIYRSH